jgi:Domain of unknown function (DUF4271)
MMIPTPGMQQDTIRFNKFLIKESVRNTFSLPAIRQFTLKDTVKHTLPTATKAIIPSPADTTFVCERNIIADVTFYDPNNAVFIIASTSYKQVPFIFTEKGRQNQVEERAFLIKQLKPGNDLPAHPLHADWMIIIIIVSAFLYSLVKATSKSIMPDFTKFFLFRGVNDPALRDRGGLFQWQSTIMNLSSFLIIGLFGYSAASYYDFIPAGFKGISIWLIALGIISVAIALRHLACVLTDVASGEHEIFRLYLLGIYQSYRFGALFLFVIIILMSYTIILPVGDFIISGIIIVGLMYMIRVIRLIIIFLNRNISIFYLILYLCALEILPVLIVIKYFTGLV